MRTCYIPLRTVIFDLVGWFEKHQRILPWRENPSVYRVWISEIMLQQTQVKTVIPYFERFMDRFPTVEDLALAKEEEVLKYWSGLGYYSRARNLYLAAQKIKKEGFPSDLKEWLALPGIGRYTAGAILSIAKNKPYPILDANIERIICRLRKIDSFKNKKRLWKISELLLHKAIEYGIKPSSWNQSLMELGALICLPKKPNCQQCAFSLVCKAYQENLQENYPLKKKKQWINLEETVFLIRDSENRILLEKQNTKWRKGLFDLPFDIPFFVEQEKLVWKQKQTIFLTVTHHKIQREIQVYDYQDILSLPNTTIDYQLLDLKKPFEDIPMGSSTKKSITKIF